MAIVNYIGFMFCLLQVFKKRVNYSQYMYDFSDGQVYKEHPLFCADGDALQLVIYTDEVETANPLGSYRGQHKLCNFLHYRYLHVLSHTYCIIQVSFTTLLEILSQCYAHPSDAYSLLLVLLHLSCRSMAMIWSLNHLFKM